MARLTRPEEQSPPSGQHGFVKAAPEALGAPMTVTIPAFSADHVFQVRYWMPRDAAIPAAGDRVLVVFDDVGEPWVPAWISGGE